MTMNKFQVQLLLLLAAVSASQCFGFYPSISSMLDRFPIVKKVLQARSHQVYPISLPKLHKVYCKHGCSSDKEKAVDFINEDHQRIPKAVRLLFHTCLAGCNGCINVKAQPNRGLIQFYNVARDFCHQHIELSLADCIVLVGISAAEVGMKKAGIENPTIPFRSGRKTCRNPDKYDEDIKFPQGDDPNAIDNLESAFSLTRNEAVALMGGHSLGSARRENSGFQGSWDRTQTTLDNGYFQSLAGNPWYIRKIGNTVQWNSRTSPDMMLVSDMTLLRDVEYDSHMRPICPAASRCPFSAEYADAVKAYARNQDLWAENFKRAVVKMIS